jgi:hypothetical protein
LVLNICRSNKHWDADNCKPVRSSYRLLIGKAEMRHQEQKAAPRMALPLVNFLFLSALKLIQGLFK